MPGSRLLTELIRRPPDELISDVACKRTLGRQWLFRTWNRAEFDDVITGRVEAYMKAHRVPNLSIALAKGDRLVFEQGYPPPFGSDVRFRVASVSKTLTATAVMTLVEAGSLDLDRTVFGDSGVLGTTYGTRPYSARVRAVTVRQLLHHTAGGWGQPYPGGVDEDPMFAAVTAGMTHRQLIGYVLDTIPLRADPGTVAGYSNFGYCVLGRVIEAVGGLPYEQYVREAVLRPCGITRMEIGGNTLATRRPDEAQYHRHPDLSATPDNDPYALDLGRMDAHGGWIARPVDLLRFMIRVDLQDTVPDLLTRGSVDAMFTGSDPWLGYGLGWGLSFVRVPVALGGGLGGLARPSILTSVSHDGAMAGTLGYLESRTVGDAACAILVNTRPATDLHAAGLAELADGILGRIGKWPEYDLFACRHL
ncbi:serine hydrolase domain-containing protein [Streptomyces huiliensis]|uniref:serine hydrolase domain-containing protein n=1 Tax=Streptomyces huiliensis TaxID=2876027 RepID=UPI001CBC8B87|nr:serine hydrolase domain-containing protein [Streptomyces huiliensis]MBZ4319678.1 beta-lactamase family protein [Streptomyces huiliensis]